MSNDKTSIEQFFNQTSDNVDKLLNQASDNVDQLFNQTSENVDKLFDELDFPDFESLISQMIFGDSQPKDLHAKTEPIRRAPATPKPKAKPQPFRPNEETYFRVLNAHKDYFDAIERIQSGKASAQELVLFARHYKGEAERLRERIRVIESGNNQEQLSFLRTQQMIATAIAKRACKSIATQPTEQGQSP